MQCGGTDLPPILCTQDWPWSLPAGLATQGGHRWHGEGPCSILESAAGERRKFIPPEQEEGCVSFSPSLPLSLCQEEDSEFCLLLLVSSGIQMIPCFSWTWISLKSPNVFSSRGSRTDSLRDGNPLGISSACPCAPAFCCCTRTLDTRTWILCWENGVHTL